MAPCFFKRVMQSIYRETQSIRCPILSKPDEYVEDAVEAILDSYSPEATNVSVIDYGKAEFRCAYAYLYLASHLQLLHKFMLELWKVEEFRNCFGSANDSETVQVCAIGGGPGTELIALRILLGEIGSNSQLVKGVVLDRYVQWQNTAGYLQQTFKLEQNDTRYCYFDFYQPLDKHTKYSIQGAKLVTMVKFVSAVADDETVAIRRLQDLLNCMQSGALLFFLDNARGNCGKLMNDVTEKCKLISLRQVTHHFFEISQDEIDAMEPKYKKRYGYYPQMTTHITLSLYVKK